MKQHSFQASLSPATVECQAENIAVCYGNAFGSTSGSRSIHGVGKLIGIDRDIGIAIVFRRQKRVVIDNYNLGVSKSTILQWYGRAEARTRLPLP